jgi:uncharacterized protein YcbX
LAAGRVAEIWRYPVKSMRGEPLDRAQLRWTGIAGDRQFAFVRSRDQSRFPWLTGRTAPEMVLNQARTGPGADPRTATLTVTTADGESFDVWDPELAHRLSALAGEPVHPMRLGCGAFDQHPVSIVTAGTLNRLNACAGAALDPHRFRINIIIAESPDAPPETEWAGRTLGFGEGPAAPALRIDESADRCVMITIDPETGRRDPGVMRMVAQAFGNRVGLYCAPSALGIVKVGDPVWLQA